MRVSGELVIRADAGAGIGVGHVMRCLGLAQAWVDRGGRATFVCASIPDSLARRVTGEGMRLRMIPVSPGTVEDADLTRETASASAWLLVDGYGFGSEWLRRVGGGARVALWTDHAHAAELPVDLILNQNPHAEPGMYARSAPRARLLLGMDFVVLRREFSGPLQRRAPRVGLGKLLVTFGGGAAAGAYEAFLAAAERLGSRLPPTVLAVGQAHPAAADILARANSLPGVSAKVAGDDFPALVESADLALCAAGATLWELAALGSPALALTIAANQEPLSSHLQSRGAGIALGWISPMTPDLIIRHLNELGAEPARITAMSRSALALVDGLGAGRVCQILSS